MRARAASHRGRRAGRPARVADAPLCQQEGGGDQGQRARQLHARVRGHRDPQPRRPPRPRPPAGCAEPSRGCEGVRHPRGRRDLPLRLRDAAQAPEPAQQRPGPEVLHARFPAAHQGRARVHGVVALALRRRAAHQIVPARRPVARKLLDGHGPRDQAVDAVPRRGHRVPIPGLRTRFIGPGVSTHARDGRRARDAQEANRDGCDSQSKRRTVSIASAAAVRSALGRGPGPRRGSLRPRGFPARGAQPRRDVFVRG